MLAVLEGPREFFKSGSVTKIMKYLRLRLDGNVTWLGDTGNTCMYIYFRAETF
jgi:hypothetical protein